MARAATGLARRIAQEALGFLTETAYTLALLALGALLALAVVWLMR